MAQDAQVWKNVKVSGAKDWFYDMLVGFYFLFIVAVCAKLGDQEQ